MKIINVLHHSLVDTTADLVRSGSFEHYYAIELQRHYPQFAYECWRPQRVLSAPVSYRDRDGIMHRVFPSYYLHKNVEYSPRLLRALTQEPADGTVGVILHGAYNLHMCRMAPILVRLPHIVQSHGGFPAVVMMKRSSRRLGRVLYLALAACERRALPRFRHVFAISNEEKRHLENVYHLDNVMWSPAGLDFDRFHPLDRTTVRRQLGIPDGIRMVLYAGRLVPEKGLYYLIDAFRIVHGADPSTLLYLVGSGPLERELRDYATLHDIPVNFVGGREHAEMTPWYSAANVFVMPSPIEWFGLSLAEALACGVPIVASRAGGAIDNVEMFESGILIPPRDSQAMAQAIRRVLDEGMPPPNTEKARRLVGWEAKARLMVELLFGVREGNNVPAPVHQTGTVGPEPDGGTR
jgi:glycosyltransferase involved in cell wall biosynthesis